MSTLVVFLLIVLPSFTVYFFTAQRTLPLHIDTFTNTVTGWNLSQHGSFYLEEHGDLTGPEYYRIVGWFIESEGGTVTQYPPGAAMWAVPFFMLSGADIETVATIPELSRDRSVINLPVPPLGAAAAAAALSVALAIGFLGLTIREFAPNRHALTAAYVFGFGTTAWVIAADQLWQHGPAMMWLALATYLSSKARFWGSGAAFGAAVVTRPLTAMFAAASGLTQGWRNRSLQPVVQIGIGASAGLAVILAYNIVVFDVVSISGGYSDIFSNRAINSTIWWYLRNILGGLIDPARGLLNWSPFLIVLIPGLRAAWRVSPAWARGPAVGAVVYLLFHWRANRFTGGDGFSGYRYPLEPLMAAGPFLYLSYREWVASRLWAQRAFGLAVAGAVALQVAVVLL